MGACYPSHKIAAQSADFGPNLTEFAKQRTPKTKIEAISKPLATISHEHEGSNGVTKDSTSITRLLQATQGPVIVKSMGKLT